MFVAPPFAQQLTVLSRIVAFEAIECVFCRLNGRCVDLVFNCVDVHFSNRQSGVKHFQAFHRCGVDVARGLVLLFGIGTKALPLWDSKTRRNNLWGGLAVLKTVGPSGHTNSPHPSSREGHLTAGWSLSFLLSRLILGGSHVTVTSWVHRNSVPSTHMRCMITANRRASATIAFFMPRCLAIFTAHALSQDHFAKRTGMI